DVDATDLAAHPHLAERDRPERPLEVYRLAPFGRRLVGLLAEQRRHLLPQLPLLDGEQRRMAERLGAPPLGDDVIAHFFRQLEVGFGGAQRQPPLVDEPPIQPLQPPMLEASERALIDLVLYLLR